MRKPFVLNLHVDKEHYYEEKIGEMPYVYKGGVYLMKGDHFGVSLELSEGSIKAVSYQPELDHADVTFDFSQEVEANGDAMMMLVIKNNTKYVLEMQALMTVPGEKDSKETSIIPVQPGLTNYESWPHPIVKLLLHSLRVGT